LEFFEVIGVCGAGGAAYLPFEPHDCVAETEEREFIDYKTSHALPVVVETEGEIVKKHQEKVVKNSLSLQRIKRPLRPRTKSQRRALPIARLPR